MNLKITCICPDLSALTDSTLSDLVDRHSDSDIIVFPEYLLELAKEPTKSFPKQLIFWGSEIDLNFNKTKVSLKGDFLSYSKQKLTPREAHLKPGSENICIHYKNVKIGLAVCYDIEFPELVPEWRKDKLDILIVPAATETLLGYERVNRCASARAVELGCAVVTSHIVGETNNDLLGANVGNHNLYLPSQSLFMNSERAAILTAKKSGDVIQSFTVDINKIREQRTLTEETNPSL